MKVLFVCTANICRSPAMELMARHLSAGDLEASSAGTHGFTDEPVSAEMAVPLGSRGLDTEGFRSRRLTRQHVADSDLVLTAEAAHRSFVLDDQPEAFRRVFTLGQFAAAVEADDPGRHGQDLVSHVGQHRGPADPTLDVADPYRRGAAANAACADQLEALLRVVVPALTGSRMITPWTT